MKKLLLILLIASSIIASDDEIELAELPRVSENAPAPVTQATPHALELEEWLDHKIDSWNYDCCNRDICFCRSLCMFLLCCWCYEV